MKSAAQQQSWFRIGSLGVAAALFVLGLGLVEACGQTVEVGLDDPLSLGGALNSSSGAGGLQLGGSLSAGTATGGSVNEAGAPACVQILCRGLPSECGDCIDNDDDGLIDTLDPDCLGPCDNDELGLSTGLLKNPGAACKQDCYFDGDNGPGNDKCAWNHQCDPLSVAPDYPPSGDAHCKYSPDGSAMGDDCASLAAVQSQVCRDDCLPVVPNGCDCFGCCELKRGTGQFQFIGAGRGAQGCQRDKLDDPIACPPCTQVHSCINDCGACETCVGGPPTDPTCDPSGACPAGGRVCGPDAPCDTGDYCVTGCCVRAPPPT